MRSPRCADSPKNTAPPEHRHHRRVLATGWRHQTQTEVDSNRIRLPPMPTTAFDASWGVRCRWIHSKSSRSKLRRRMKMTWSFEVTHETTWRWERVQRLVWIFYRTTCCPLQVYAYRSNVLWRTTQVRPRMVTSRTRPMHVTSYIDWRIHPSSDRLTRRT